MLKLLTLFILFTAFLQGSEKVEIYATALNSKDNIVEASGGVTVIYGEYILTSKKATYNKESGDLELFENIRVNSGNSHKIIGAYAKINIAQKERLFRPFYMLDKSSKVWLSADEGKTKDDDIDISSGVVSGCNPNDPLWQMEFSSSDYNAKTKWLNLYNTRLYIYDVPVFYTPYFGYSLDKTRRTGLLMPAIGLSKSEGFYYEQPIYIAESDSWDLELRPQIRTKRGAGIYSDFRFVDSKTSSGKFEVGYFKEQSAYAKEHNLENESHFGFNFEYDNNDFLNQWLGTSFEGQSGLYTDINHMNDVDYINLSTNDNVEQTTARQVLSRVNMFYNTDDNYIGAYFKYYQDLSEGSNKETLQKLPTLQYHYYLDTLFKDHLLYSLDLQSTNVYRETNTTVIQTNMNIPVKLQANLFDELINVAYTSNIYTQQSTFGGDKPNSSSSIEYNDGYFFRNYHTFTASTHLTKAFSELTHVVGFELKHTMSGYESQNGYYEDNGDFCADSDNKEKLECKFYDISEIQEVTRGDFTQYIFDSSASQILYHRLSQRILHSSDENRYGELENELDYKITNTLSFYNNMFYNFDESLFSKIYNKVSFNDYGLNVDFSHLYKENISKLPDDPYRHTSYITSTARYTYDKHYTFNALYNYDLELDLRKSMEVGFLYQKRCWDFGIRYVENNRPILTTVGEDSVYDKYIYLTIVLKPFMETGSNSSNLYYRFPEEE